MRNLQLLPLVPWHCAKQRTPALQPQPLARLLRTVLAKHARQACVALHSAKEPRGFQRVAVNSHACLASHNPRDPLKNWCLRIPRALRANSAQTRDAILQSTGASRVGLLLCLEIAPYFRTNYCAKPRLAFARDKRYALGIGNWCENRDLQSNPLQATRAEQCFARNSAIPDVVGGIFGAQRRGWELALACLLRTNSQFRVGNWFPCAQGIGNWCEAIPTQGFFFAIGNWCYFRTVQSNACKARATQSLSRFQELVCTQGRGQDLNLRSPDYEPGEITSFSTPLKESIQPQVPLRLPCYDLTPVTKQAIMRLVF